MAGALSSLGIGSGVLTSKVIDQLKQADEGAMIDPIKRRLVDTKKKEMELNTIKASVSLLQGNANDFADGSLMDKRLANVVGDSVTASVVNGIEPQTINLDVKQLAQNDIFESIKYKDTTSKINSTGDAQNIKITVNGTDTKIKVKKDATLSDLKEEINNSGAGVTASIIDTGDDDKPYRLVIKGNDTGKDNKVKIDFSAIDNIGLNDTKYQSKHYDDDTKSVTDDDTKIKFTINGTDYSMDVDANTSVKDFVDDINNNSDMQDAGVSAKYNSDSGRIEFKMKEVGDVSIDEGKLNTSINSETDFTNDNRVQKAQDVEFKYNGVDVTRSKNKVDDMVAGLTLNFQKTGTSTVNITRDDDGIVKSINDFFSGYNTLMSKVDADTAYNPNTKTAAVFQGNSTIQGITNTLNRNIFNTYVNTQKEDTDRNGEVFHRNVELTSNDFGISMGAIGNVKFDASKFKQMLKTNGKDAETFISDLFGKMKKSLDGLVKGPNSALQSMTTGFKKDETSFQDEISSTQKRLDAKYNTMSSQFAAYDSIINKYKNMSSSLNMQIAAYTNSK